jgi:hypothetical protein
MVERGTSGRPVIALLGDDLIRSTVGFNVGCNDAGHDLLRGINFMKWKQYRQFWKQVFAG